MKFTNIPLKDMIDFLTPLGFKEIAALEGTLEKVYAKRVDHHGLALSLRVYTGIEGTESRGVGEDAIRVALFMRDKDGRIVKLGGSKRVHRVIGWKKNLKNRLDRWEESFPTNVCNKCGMPMLPRNGRCGKFLGCASFPKCTNTRPIESTPTPATTPPIATATA